MLRSKKMFYIPDMHAAWYFVLLSLIVGLGCGDAPRDNPLDPLSPQYTGLVAVRGTVLLRDQNTPIADARVTSLRDSISVFTDANGRFTFAQLTSGAQTLVCTMENFVSDTVRVVLGAGTTQDVSFSLNGAPVVLLQTIVTRKIDQYYPSAQYYADVSAAVTDPNGIADLDSVWFAADVLRFPMDYIPSTKRFQITLSKYDLPTNSIQWLVGIPLHIVSRDRSGALNTSGAFFVTRVIETGATPSYPSSANSDTTTGTPLLMWLPPSVTFSYTYALNISQVNAGTETSVWSVGGLDSFDEEYQFPGGTSSQTLPSGTYVWSVAVVDEFGNTCRSKEASFVVR